MAITNNSSYIPTINEFIPHWTECNLVMGASPLLARLPDDTTRSLAQFTSMRGTLIIRQNNVQAALTAQQIARAGITLQKEALLARLNVFISELDAYFQATEIYPTRPYAPSVGAGQEAFLRPMVDAVNCWTEVNAGDAPQGVTLPLVLADGTTVSAMSALVEELSAAYLEEQGKAYQVALARARRNSAQDIIYATIKAYREAVYAKLKAYPELTSTLPRLTPLPGRTPLPVNASAIFLAPNMTRVVYDASNDIMLERYELRGTVGDFYDEEDAVVIDTHTPGEAREFTTSFGLTQPGAEIALKVYVVLTTGNEAGSASMQVERPASVQLMAA